MTDCFPPESLTVKDDLFLLWVLWRVNSPTPEPQTLPQEGRLVFEVVTTYHCRAQSGALVSGVLYRHVDNVSRPSELVVGDHCLDTRDIGLGEDAHIGTSILQMDLQE
eukprot:g40337.t1